MAKVISLLCNNVIIKKTEVNSRTTYLAFKTKHDYLRQHKNINRQKEDDKYTRWKIENSHGDKTELKGFLTMSDAFMDQYGICAFVHKNSLKPDLRKVYKDTKNIKWLPFFDVLGTFAH